jgi:N-acetylneuraminic acid mutarotase
MLFFASIYALPNTKWVVVLRLHLSAFDHTTSASLLRELLVLMGEGEEGEETHKEMAMS